MTDLKIVKMNNEKIQSGENVIERLEQALEMAKAGDIKNCVISCVLNNGDVMDCWANGSDPFVVVGALESVKREFMDSIIEAR